MAYETEFSIIQQDPDIADIDAASAEMTRLIPIVEITSAPAHTNGNGNPYLNMEGISEKFALHMAAVVVEDRETVTQESGTLYKQEIGMIPLLTPEEELELAEDRELGVIAQEKLDAGFYSEKDKTKLEKQAADGKKARERLIESNLRLVVAVARKHIGRGVDEEDLISEGNFGLFRAADKFDYRRGFRFSTVAYWWIRQAVVSARIDQGRVIRVPRHGEELIGDVYDAELLLSQELGRGATNEEIAALMELPVERIWEIKRTDVRAGSLDVKRFEHDREDIGESIVDPDALNPADAAEGAVLKGMMQEVIVANLIEEDAIVLRLRWGLEDGKTRTQAEVAEELGLTQQRVQQRESRAINTLRRAKLRGKFRGF